MNRYVIYSLFWGLISLLFEDYSYILFLMFFIMWDSIKQKKINFDKGQINLLIFSVVIQMMLSLLCEVFTNLIYLILSKLFNISSFFVSHSFRSILSVFVNIIFVLIIVKLIRENYAKINEIEEKILSLKLNNRFFLMLISIFLSFEIILFVGNIQEITYLMNVTILFSFMFFAFLLCWQMVELVQSVSIRQKTINDIEQNRQMREYLTNIQEQYDDLRKFKHDFKNIVLSISADSKKNMNKDYEDIYKELVQQKGFVADLDGKTILELKKIANEPIRGLIIQKFFKARSNNIKINIEIVDDCIKFTKNLLEIIRVVGILLDNSIEEAASGDKREVRVAFIKNQDTIEVSVENPINHFIDVRNIFKKEYSTKGKNRGIGLTNVSEIINKNSNLFLDTEIKGKFLRITLIVLEV
ncbi:sensor histidine kinase [Companilactobacillus alimentarius]|nr:GHKL domain-containing protein [Companilactobacillus alimentarius]